MTLRMRIGEILLMQEAVDPWVLRNTIREQASTGRRLVSLLISRAHLDPDQGALALSEQLNYPAALQRHLERHDPQCATAIPVDLCQRWMVLPLGRSRRGGLVVVARDPTPFLAASLEHIYGASIELAVCPSIQLERLMRATYGGFVIQDAERAPAPSAPVADIDLADPEVLPRKPRTLSRVLLDDTPDLPQRRGLSFTRQLDNTLQLIERSISRAAAEQHALEFAVKYWRAMLFVAIRDGAAWGRLGTSPIATEHIAVSAATPSLIQVAHETRAPTAARVHGEVHDRVSALLGNAAAPAAVPIIVGGVVESVMVVGDLIVHDLRNPLARLSALGDALGVAFERAG